MSELVAVAIINNVPNIIAAVFSVICVLIALGNKGKLKAVHYDINGRFSELLHISKEAARLAGIQEGIIIERARFNEAVITDRAERLAVKYERGTNVASNHSAVVRTVLDTLATNKEIEDAAALSLADRYVVLEKTEEELAAEKLKTPSR